MYSIRFGYISKCVKYIPFDRSSNNLTLVPIQLKKTFRSYILYHGQFSISSTTFDNWIEHFFHCTMHHSQIQRCRCKKKEFQMFLIFISNGKYIRYIQINVRQSLCQFFLDSSNNFMYLITFLFYFFMCFGFPIGIAIFGWNMQTNVKEAFDTAIWHALVSVNEAKKPSIWRRLLCLT